MNFCVAILILKMEENTQHFQLINYAFLLQDVRTQLKIFFKDLCSCMEKVLWLIKYVKSGFWSFVLEISRWMMLLSQEDQLKQSNRDINWEQSRLYNARDSQHTQNIQINIVIGENKNVSFVLQKNHMSFLANPITRLWVQSPVGAHMGGNWLIFVCHIDISLSPLLSQKSINISSVED